MDIFAHGLWTAAAAKGVKKVTRKPVRVGLAAFFGVFPDLFAFTLLTFWMGVHILNGSVLLSDLPHPSDFEPSAPDTIWIFRVTSALYTLSHSIFVFAAVLAIVLILRRKMPWVMLGWPFHVLIDVFTHSYGAYPTPVLWPFSSWRFDGLSWETPWFLVLNYIAIVSVYLTLFLLKRRHVKKMAFAYEQWKADMDRVPHLQEEKARTRE